MNHLNAQKYHNPDPGYLRSLIESAGISQQEAARRIGINVRMTRFYLAGTYPIPYPIQFAAERLRKQKK